MTPRLNISAFSPSYGIPYITSGAAYAEVPTFPVWCLAFPSIVRIILDENPKSRSLIINSSPLNTILSVFKSLWQSPIRCKYLTAFTILINITLTNLSSKFSLVQVR